MMTMEMYHNVDLSGVTAAATTNEIAFSRTSQPATRYYRLLAIASLTAAAPIRFTSRGSALGRAFQNMPTSPGRRVMRFAGR